MNADTTPMTADKPPATWPDAFADVVWYDPRFT
jgi:hypothetical protein